MIESFHAYPSKWIIVNITTTIVVPNCSAYITKLFNLHYQTVQPTITIYNCPSQLQLFRTQSKLDAGVTCRIHRPQFQSRTMLPTNVPFGHCTIPCVIYIHAVVQAHVSGNRFCVNVKNNDSNKCQMVMMINKTVCGRRNCNGLTSWLKVTKDTRSLNTSYFCTTVLTLNSIKAWNETGLKSFPFNSNKHTV